MTAAPVRRAAWEVLTHTASGEPFDVLLDAALAAAGDDRDRRFLAELTKGTLRWQGRYDHLVRRFSRRKAEIDPEVATVLRLGLHQLLGMDRVPDHAALHQSVDLVRDVAGPRPAPFVNAVLQAVRRAVAGGEPALHALFPDPARDPDGWLAAWWSHPLWLVSRWRARFGPGETAELCRRNNTPPPLALHVLEPEDPQAAAERLAADGVEVAPGRLSPRALLVAGADRAGIASLLAADPRLIVQDEAVQAACDLLLGDLEPPVLDVCAAPGGKTLRLRARLGADAALVAADLSAARLRLLRENAKRIDAGPDVVVSADGRAAPFPDRAFGTVLLDGPCTGTGVLRRHPEGRWRLQPQSIGASAARLAALAREALRVLRPGGRLLYATCSLEPEENAEVVAGLVAAGLAVPDPWPDLGDWRHEWLPQREGADGFFAARLKRVGGAE